MFNLNKMKQKNKTTEAYHKPNTSAPEFKDFFCPPNTDLGEFLLECEHLLEFAPDILDRIQADQERLGLEKKASRLEDRRWVEQQSSSLFDQEEIERIEQTPPPPAEEKVTGKGEELEIGRGRMPAELVFVLLMCRGYLGGTTTTLAAINQLNDSRALDAWLGRRGWQLPKPTTIYENLNAVSATTKDYMLRMQMKFGAEKGLADYKHLGIDSTAVEANSAWPTDPAMILGLLNRAYRTGRKLSEFGLKPIPKKGLPKRLKELEPMPFEINLVAGKGGATRRLYMCFCNQATKIVSTLLDEYGKLKSKWEGDLSSGKLSPSQKKKAQEQLSVLDESITAVIDTLRQTCDRVFQGKKIPARDRILSLNDRSAAMICKGGRQPVLGYKPQLCRSGEGLITYMEVPEGNASDSRFLTKGVQETIDRTGVVPDEVTLDDGYASKKGLEETRALGVKVVSISGAKGKKLLSEEWEQPEYKAARNRRSAVESLMFCLKFSFHFGRTGRKGIERVRHELMERCLAYNLCRIRLLRMRKEEKLAAA